MHEVKTGQDKRAFLDFPLTIYRNDPNWIHPLDKDIEAVFDPAKNKSFKHGECNRWLLKDDEHKVIGRIAAFINKKYKNDQPTGGIGFFECINDQQAAAYMFDHCKAWLEQRGMQAMDGPINFGERDKWWGLQVQGFQPPLYNMNYNPSYYIALFEQYGFRVYFYQLCYALKVKERLQDKFHERHDELSKDPHYKAVMLRKTDLDKFAKDFAYIYNKAFAVHGEGKTLEERTAIKMFRSMKPAIDEHIIWFTYYKEQPIAMWVNLPDLNQYFKHMKGKFGWLQQLYFIWLQQFGKCSRFVGLVFGIIPEFHGKGVDAYMIVEAAKLIQKRLKYEDFEMQWIGDFNPKMINIAESLGTHCSRRLATYRYLFDRTKEFKRHEFVGMHPPTTRS